MVKVVSGEAPAYQPEICHPKRATRQASWGAGRTYSLPAVESGRSRQTQTIKKTKTKACTPVPPRFSGRTGVPHDSSLNDLTQCITLGYKPLRAVVIETLAPPLIHAVKPDARPLTIFTRTLNTGKVPAMKALFLFSKMIICLKPRGTKRRGTHLLVLSSWGGDLVLDLLQRPRMLPCTMWGASLGRSGGITQWHGLIGMLWCRFILLIGIRPPRLIEAPSRRHRACVVATMNIHTLFAKSWHIR